MSVSGRFQVFLLAQKILDSAAHELTISFGWRPPGSGEQQLQAIDVPIFRFATSKENLFGYQLRISIDY